MKKIFFIAAVVIALMVLNFLQERSTDFTARGTAKHAQGDYQGAVADFTKAVELEHASPEAYAGRARSKSSLGDVDGAIADYGRAIAAFADFRVAHNNPAYAEAYNSRGALKSMQKDDAEALEDFTAALEISPAHVQAYANRAFAHTRLGNYAAAYEDYCAAIERSPDSDLLYYNRGAVRVWLGDTGAACSDWEQAVILGSSAARDAISRHCE